MRGTSRTWLVAIGVVGLLGAACGGGDTDAVEVAGVATTAEASESTLAKPTTTEPPETTTTTTTEAPRPADPPATEPGDAAIRFVEGYLAGTDTSVVATAEARQTLEACGIREQASNPQVALSARMAGVRTGFPDDDPCPLVGDVTIACFVEVSWDGGWRGLEVNVADPTVTGPEWENVSATWVVNRVESTAHDAPLVDPVSACGELPSESGYRVGLFAIAPMTCERAHEVWRAYEVEPDKQGSSAFAYFDGFECYVDLLHGPSPGDVSGSCTSQDGSQGDVELRVL